MLLRLRTPGPLAVLVLASCSGGTDAVSPPNPTPSPTPTPPPVSRPRVVATLDSAVLRAGDTLALTAQAFDANGAPLSVFVTWTSLTPGLLEIIPSGVAVRGIEEGAAAVQASALGVTDTVRVRVTPAPAMTARLTRPVNTWEWAQLLVDSGRIVRGEATYAFASSDTTVARVDSAGRVFGERAGSASITVRRSFLGGTRGDTARLDLSVGPPPTWMPIMSVEFTGGYVPTAREARLITQAVRRWQNVLVRPAQLTFRADMPPRFGACNPTNAPVTRIFDGIRVFVQILPDSLAGPGVGAYGGWCMADTDGNPRMIAVDLVNRFVQDFRLNRHAPEYFEAVAIHEIGHGLGVVHLMAPGRPQFRVRKPDSSFVFTGPNAVAALGRLTGRAVTEVPLSPDGFHFNSLLNTPEIGEALAGGGRISALSLGVLADQGTAVRLERAESRLVTLPGSRGPSIFYRITDDVRSPGERVALSRARASTGVTP